MDADRNCFLHFLVLFLSLISTINQTEKPFSFHSFLSSFTHSKQSLTINIISYTFAFFLLLSKFSHERDLKKNYNFSFQIVKMINFYLCNFTFFFLFFVKSNNKILLREKEQNYIRLASSS